MIWNYLLEYLDLSKARKNKKTGFKIAKNIQNKKECLNFLDKQILTLNIEIITEIRKANNNTQFKNQFNW